MSTVIRSHVYI